MIYWFFFFFSSRRRHTRCSRDWSSDVCSSDLDNGTWLETHRQTWSANSPGTLSFVNNVWNTAYAGIARSNVLLEALQADAKLDPTHTIEGEARFLRAFYYYLLMDVFGGVPIATTTELKARGRATA